MDTLFAISVSQPWLEMILRGAKTIEIRNQSTIRRGHVALHAPWRIDYSAAFFYGFTEPWKMSRGRIVAVAEVVEVIEFDRDSSLQLLESHRQYLPVGSGSYGIVFGEVRPLEGNLRCRGRLGFFPVPERISQHIREQIQGS